MLVDCGDITGGGLKSEGGTDISSEITECGVVTTELSVALARDGLEFVKTGLDEG